MIADIKNKPPKRKADPLRIAENVKLNPIGSNCAKPDAMEDHSYAKRLKMTVDHNLKVGKIGESNLDERFMMSVRGKMSAHQTSQDFIQGATASTSGISLSTAAGHGTLTTSRSSSNKVGSGKANLTKSKSGIFDNFNTRINLLLKDDQSNQIFSKFGDFKKNSSFYRHIDLQTHNDRQPSNQQSNSKFGIIKSSFCRNIDLQLHDDDPQIVSKPVSGIFEPKMNKSSLHPYMNLQPRNDQIFCNDLRNKISPPYSTLPKADDEFEAANGGLVCDGPTAARQQVDAALETSNVQSVTAYDYCSHDVDGSTFGVAGLRRDVERAVIAKSFRTVTLPALPTTLIVQKCMMSDRGVQTAPPTGQGSIL